MEETNQWRTDVLMGLNKNRYIKLQNDVAELLIEAVNSATLNPDEVHDIVNHIITTVIEAVSVKPSSTHQPYDQSKSQIGTMRND